MNSEVLLFTKEEFYLQILKLGYIMKQMMYRGTNMIYFYANKAFEVESTLEVLKGGYQLRIKFGKITLYA